MYYINFIAYAYDKPHSDTYQSFLIPFTFFALRTEPNSHVEIIIDNVPSFTKKYEKELSILRTIHTHFLIREPSHKYNQHMPNTYRFFEKPHVSSTYTYILDIDIMLLDHDILNKYLQSWPPNLPYNNMLRYPNTSQITGVHMVKNDQYFTHAFTQCQLKYYHGPCENDEIILGKMCSETFGLPDFSHRFRPIYGIHFSPNRGNNKIMRLTTSRTYYNKFMDIAKQYPILFQFNIFNKLVLQLHQDFHIK